MARYLVTGGCGFIGGHLCRALFAAGHQLVVLDDLSSGSRDALPHGAQLIEGDVADFAAVKRAMSGTAGCFHLAAIASVQKCAEDWLGSHRVNQGGTIAVLQAARDLGRLPVVYASSAAIYGDNNDLPLRETHRPAPLSAYGADKLGSELHARVASLTYQVPTTGCRFFNVFGPGQNPSSPYSGVISIFASLLKRRQSLTIFGDGRQSRDFIYVGDVVDHLIAAMQSSGPTARIFNVCGGRATSLLELVTLLGDIIGATPQLRFDAARPGDITHSLGSPDFCRSALGRSATTSLADGLAITLGRD